LNTARGYPVVAALLIVSYPTVRQPNTVAVAPGGHTLWITGTEAGTVERITR
jgi:sugar lactone lactonase YvrE